MGEVIDFQKEKEKRRLGDAINYPNEGPIPTQSERMMNVVQSVDIKAQNSSPVWSIDWEASYHENAIIKDDSDES